MAADPDHSAEDRAALQRLRQRLYQPSAGAADRAAYDLLLQKVGSVKELPSTLESPAPPNDSVEEDPSDPGVQNAPSGAVRHRRGWKIIAAAGVAAVSLVLVLVLVVQATAPTLGPLLASPSRFAPLPDAEDGGSVPTGVGGAAAASYFQRIPATAAERTTAARKPFFGAGVGPTDFALRQFDIGATSISVTLVTDQDAKVSTEVASRSPVSELHRVFLARGSARGDRAVSAESSIRGLEDPTTLRVEVPQDVRFIVKAVFLAPIDTGTIDH